METSIQIYREVRLKLNNPNLAVRLRGDTVEVFGFPPYCEKILPQWYFVGTLKDFDIK